AEVRSANKSKAQMHLSSVKNPGSRYANRRVPCPPTPHRNLSFTTTLDRPAHGTYVSRSSKRVTHHDLIDLNAAARSRDSGSKHQPDRLPNTSQNRVVWHAMSAFWPE